MTTKERPIIFSGPMVRAILEGKKTQTRRVVKGLRAEGVGRCHWSGTGWAYLASDGGCTCQPVRCPYGEPGDRLWVRETWRVCGGREYEYLREQSQVMYRSTHEKDGFPLTWESYAWRPSIFMPRWASRITLEVRSVKVERLQDISGPDCWAEGIEHAGWDCERYGSVVECYRDLWQSINGADSWDANPWVWVVEFRRVGVAA